MAAEIKEKLGVDARVTPGGRGQFDVLKNGTAVYSKAKTNKFPDPGEISSLLNS